MGHLRQWSVEEDSTLTRRTGRMETSCPLTGAPTAANELMMIIYLKHMQRYVLFQCT